MKLRMPKMIQKSEVKVESKPEVRVNFKLGQASQPAKQAWDRFWVKVLGAKGKLND